MEENKAPETTCLPKMRGEEIANHEELDEELEEISEEVRQMLEEAQEARSQSRQAEWFSLAALAISLIHFIIKLAMVSQC